MEKLLSIVIPTYNMEKFLRRCLDSLIVSDEDMKMLEVLVINDGSNDLSSNIAHEYETRYPQTYRVIDKKNGNYGSCINCGIDNAKGVFFKILDADDWYSTDGLSRLLKKIDHYKDKVDAIFSEFMYHDYSINKDTLYSYKTIEYEKIYTMNDVSLAETEDEKMLKMYGISIKTDILRRINLRLDTGISYTDNEYMYFLYSEIATAVFLNLNIYQYFKGREGQTISPENRIKHINDLFVVVERMLDDYIKNQQYYIGLFARSSKENQIVSCAKVFYGLLLGLDFNIENDKKMKILYNKIKQVGSIRNKMFIKSPFFALWAITGLYKSGKVLKPIWELSNLIKK